MLQRYTAYEDIATLSRAIMHRRVLQGQAMQSAPYTNSGGQEVAPGAGCIEIFAEEDWEEGRRQAEELASLLRSKRPEQKFKLELKIPRECRAGSIVFHRRGPELLKAGEEPGHGLHTELPEVLRLQVGLPC
jgi:hypothetical protein